MEDLKKIRAALLEGQLSLNRSPWGESRDENPHKPAVH